MKIKKTKRVEFRLDEGLFEQLKSIKNFSAFARTALLEKLGEVNHAE